MRRSKRLARERGVDDFERVEIRRVEVFARRLLLAVIENSGVSQEARAFAYVRLGMDALTDCLGFPSARSFSSDRVAMGSPFTDAAGSIVRLQASKCWEKPAPGWV